MISLEKSLLHDSSCVFYRRQTLCYTLSGHSCPLLTITNLAKEKSEEMTEGKKYVVLSARVHPGESNSSWIMKGSVGVYLFNSSLCVWVCRGNRVFVK